MKRRFITAFVAFGLAAASGSLLAQDSAKQRRWIVPYPAGGASDFLARNVGQSLHEATGQTFIYETRPGGNGSIAMSELMRSPAESATLINVDNGIMVFNPALYRSLTYSPKRDLAPVAMLGRSNFILVVPAASGITDVKDFLTQAKAQPGRLSYGSAGAGSPQHLAMELLKRVAGIDLVHVPYRGGAPAVADTAGGHLFAMMADYAAARPFLESGKLRVLAVANSSRFAPLPDVPTLAEKGLPVEAFGWIGVAVQAGTPAQMVQSLNASIIAALGRPPLNKRLRDMGFEVVNISPQEFSALIESESDRWHKLIRELKISLE